MLGFDVYGTLFDVASVEDKVHKFAGENARQISAMWRSKQLEYSFRRALMKRHADFSVCGEQALEYAFAYHQCALSGRQKDELLAVYSHLPLFPDVLSTLENLGALQCSMYAFSNGSAESIEALLERAGIRGYFTDVVSAEEVSSFKPDPTLYGHFMEKTKAQRDDAWLISCNAFDIIGAVSFGMKAAWIRRNESDVFDPWEIQPTSTLKSLSEIENALRS
ncbi:MAG TPA: haloacid dehalogenase type II [Burkholderiales bacterium]|nr:haloacid dehalogenase type II [Burkholderiales bacterium]